MIRETGRRLRSLGYAFELNALCSRLHRQAPWRSIFIHWGVNRKNSFYSIRSYLVQGKSQSFVI